MKNIELNQNVVNKIIAFKMLEILRNHNIISPDAYKSIERKREQYNENIVKQGKIYKGGN